MGIRVLIVDDEPIAAQATAYMARKACPDLEVVGKCYSGREAVTSAVSLRPDIIIIDIQMPGINGLEAIRRILERSSDMRFIILSAHSDFSYAVEALNLGASDYLLKPVKQVEFTQSLLKVIHDIQDRKADMDDALVQQERIQLAIPMIRKDFLYALLPESNSDERLVVCASFLGLLETKGFALVILQRSGEQTTPLSSVVNALSQTKGVLTDLVRPGVAIAYVPLSSESGDEKTRMSLIAELSSLLALHSSPGHLLTAGVGDIQPGALEMKRSLAQAFRAAHRQEAMDTPPQNSVLIYDAATSGPEDVAPTEHDPVLDTPVTALRIISKANQFIESHFDKDITLDDIASHVNLSPYYFSRFYKEYAGLNFSEKLLNLRMEKAKAYLARPNSSIKDTAYMVGYNDPNYFSKVFRKVCGITASEYRELSRTKPNQTETVR